MARKKTRADYIAEHKKRQAAGDYDALRRSWNWKNGKITRMMIEENEKGTPEEEISKKIKELSYSLGLNVTGKDEDWK